MRLPQRKGTCNILPARGVPEQEIFQLGGGQSFRLPGLAGPAIAGLLKRLCDAGSVSSLDFL